jgi:hypothetical protein
MMSAVLDFFPISRVRRNHALEHATLQVLGQKRPHTPMAGYSDWGGITILGNVSTEELQEAVEEARTRLVAGEHGLAIHAHCGTNFATSGLVAGSVAWLVMLGEGGEKRAKRLPLVVSLVTIALILSLPLGPLVQRRITTDAQIGELEVTQIMMHHRGNMILHRILTRY